MDSYPSRRSVLRTLLGLMLGLAARTRRAGAVAHPAPSSVAALRLARLLPQRRSAAVVGAAYLRGHPAEANADVLVERICDDASVRRWVAQTAEPEQLRRWFGRRRQRDFEQGQVVVLDGWVLARSEARLCALIGLL